MMKDATSLQQRAPWYVIPADHRHVMQVFCSAIIVDATQSPDLRWPTVSEHEREADEIARRQLEAEDAEPASLSTTPLEV
jgi:hypothetical protein